MKKLFNGIFKSLSIKVKVKYLAYFLKYFIYLSHSATKFWNNFVSLNFMIESGLCGP